MKAIRISADPAESPPPAAEVVERARRFLAAGADAILLDSKTGRRPAGTGAAIERSLARAVAAALDAPLILAGGLTPENVAAAILEVQPGGGRRDQLAGGREPPEAPRARRRVSRRGACGVTPAPRRARLEH